MKLGGHSIELIQTSLKEAIDKYKKEYGDETYVTDIHLSPKQSTGELIVFDDDENELAQTVIEEWADYDRDDFYSQVERQLSAQLSVAKENGIFSDLSILMPYSFVLVDEDKETISELLLMDDDTLLVNDELLKGLDEELDQFLKELLN